MEISEVPSFIADISKSPFAKDTVEFPSKSLISTGFSEASIQYILLSELFSPVSALIGITLSKSQSSNLSKYMLSPE